MGLHHERLVWIDGVSVLDCRIVPAFDEVHARVVVVVGGRDEA